MWRMGAVLGAAALAFFATASARAADNALSAQANQAFLASNAKQQGIHVRPSGLQYRIIRSGYGKSPAPTDSVAVYYKGNLINGTVFDQTEPGMPAQFVANKLIPGWTEALEIMREGDHWQLVIPAGLAYGARGAGGVIPPNQTLVFDLELLKVTPAPKDQGSDQSE